MTPPRKTLLALERLEDRTVPATSAAVWPDPGHLTLSLVPDGTLIGSTPSNLSQVVASANQTASGPPAGVTAASANPAEAAILQAFQTWAVNSNINIGVVPDNGSPLSTADAVEGDPRFGDIRIAAEPQVPTSLATTTPYAPGSSWSGTVVLNSTCNFSLGGQATGSAATYDLYTALLHEAGLIFNQSESTDPTSAMDEQYQGLRTGLSTTDIQNLQAVYGPRTPDANAASSFAHPVTLRSASGAPPSSLLSASGSLSTNQDVDTYAFRVDSSSHPAGINIQLQAAGVSLLTSTLSVYDATTNLVATTSTLDPLNNNLSVHLNNVASGAQYYIKVTGAQANVFGIGSYNLTVNLHPENSNPTGPQAIAGAQPLGTPGSSAGPLVANGTISANQTSAVYRVHTPSAASPMTVSLQSWGLGMTSPTLTVYDSAGNVLGTTTSTNPLGGNLSLTVNSLSPKADYFVRVQSSVTTPLGLGAYRLQVDMQASASPHTNLLAAPPGPNKVTNLQPLPGGSPQGTLEAIGSLQGPTDSDYFRVKAANGGPGQSVLLTASVLSQTPSALAPVIAVFDNSGNAVNATVLSNVNGNYVVQVAGAQSNQSYLIQVSPGGQGNTTGEGNYYLSVISGVGPATTLLSLTGGTLTTAVPQGGNTLTLNQNVLLNFVLSAQTGPIAPLEQVTMLIYDALGNLVYAQSATVGQPPTSGTVYLAQGTYTVQFVAASLTSVAVQPVTYSLGGQVLSSPIDPTVIDPTGSISTTTPTTEPPSTIYSTDPASWSSTYSTAWLTNPYSPPYSY
jgi:hypothetical protein